MAGLSAGEELRMEYRALGRAGMKVSALGLGTNAFGKRSDRETSIAIVEQALDAGITFIDTANIYASTESESIIGQALAGKRQQAVLATKAGLPMGAGPNDRGSSRFHLMRELEGSLRRLQTDYVDLYQIHTFDPYTPLEETLRALDDMVRSGKVRYIGASNYAAWELMKALGTSDLHGLNRYASIQLSYSLADRTPERELVPLSQDQGLGIIPYFPLAGGILSGKYTSRDQVPAGSRAETSPDFVRMMRDDMLTLGNQVRSLAEAYGCSPSALSLAWLMERPCVSTVIVGASRPEQVVANAYCLEIKLDDELRAKLDMLSAFTRNGDPLGWFRI